MMRMIGVVFVIAAVVALVGCEDKAKPDYVKCVQADTAGDAVAAWTACNAAVAADPNSTSGKEAAKRLDEKILDELKPKYDAWKADQDAKAAAAAQAAAQARADAIASARRKITLSYWGHDPDDQCTALGKPPYRINYGGGKLAEDQMVARADGCEALYPNSTDPLIAITFCCPQ